MPAAGAAKDDQAGMVRPGVEQIHSRPLPTIGTQAGASLPASAQRPSLEDGAFMGMEASSAVARTRLSRSRTKSMAGTVLASASPATSSALPPHSRMRAAHASDVSSCDPVKARSGCFTWIAVSGSSSLRRTSGSPSTTP
jgi:hypothetical protein